MPNYKTITHVFAVALAGLASFVVTPAGQALIKQYPWSSGIVAVVLTLAAVYHIPVVGPTLALSAAVTKAPQ
jgi:hypothetical protein